MAAAFSGSNGFFYIEHKPHLICDSAVSIHCHITKQLKHALGQVLEKLGPTLILTLSSIVLSVLIAVPLGIMSAYKPYSARDYASSGFAFVGASTPTFFTGLVMIFIFAVKLKVLPMGGMYDAGEHTAGAAVRHLILPCLVLTIFNIGSILRQTRGSMMEVFSEDYIRTARAKGLMEPRVVIVHGLRNALIPVVTVLSTMIPFMFGGAVVAEQVFSWPGLGSLMVQSINSRDYPMIMGITVVIAAAVLIGNVLTDIAYSLLDPYTSDVLAFSAKPGPGHIFGTDDTGRDVFARLVYGGRVSLLVGLLSVVISLSLL